MFSEIDRILNTIPNQADKTYMRDLIQKNDEIIGIHQETIGMLQSEQQFLREQVSLAIRSLKFDLYPELSKNIR